MRTVSRVRCTPHLTGRRLDLTWTNPPAEDFAGEAPLAGIRVVRRERTHPLDRDDGEVAYDGPVIDRLGDDGLPPLTSQYYTVFAVDLDGHTHADGASRASGFATADFGHAAQLYRLLPAVHQRSDRPLADDATAALPPDVRRSLDALPPELRGTGQLFRFLSAAAAPLDLVRSFAEGLRRLRDPAAVPAEFLGALGQWLGWEINRSVPLFAQRNEVSFAPALYRGVGTVPNLRAIVNRYTGWHVQVAEMAQSIARSNAPPQLNVFMAEQRADGSWRGADDAAAVLGLAPGNRSTHAGAATLTGTTEEPFRLRPAMRLTLTADQQLPVTVVFGPDDFADPAAATAAEVAAVLNRTLSEVTATTAGGRLVLSSHTSGAGSGVQAEESVASLVTLEGAPAGRLAVVTAAADRRVRLFYATTDPPLPGPGTVLRGKTFRAGRWGEAVPIPTGSPASADPAAAELADGQMFLAWVDAPHTDAARLRFAVGEPRAAQPARLRSRRTAPFVVRPGSRLVLRSRGRRQGVVFGVADFPDPTRVDAVALAAVLSARLTGLTAAPGPDGTLEVRTDAAGGDQQIAVELAGSDAAGALGFDPANAAADGEWGDEFVWSAPEDVPPAVPGAASRVAQPAAVAEGPARVRLFWCGHDDARWTILTAAWDTTGWGPAEVLAAGDGGNVEPAAVRTADGSDQVWLFFSRRDGVGTTADRWTLRRRILDLATGSWGPEAAVQLPSGAPLIGREPVATVAPDASVRLFFRSDRLGGDDIWSASLTVDDRTVTEPVPVLPGPAVDRWPAPVPAPHPATWLLFRSDRGVALSGLTTRELPAQDNRVTRRMGGRPPEGTRSRSLRVTNTGTLRRFAGTTTVVLDDVARLERRRRWDDPQAYTPNRPRGGGPGGRLTSDELYTRGTVALYLSPVVPESVLSAQLERQLQPILDRFLPITVRAVVRFAPRDTVEFVYRPDADLVELPHRDVHPFLERHAGVADATGAAVPDWVRLLATTRGHVSADPAAPASLRHRSWFDDPS